MTPVLVVINELSRHEPRLRVRFVCDKGFESQSRGLMVHAVVPVQVSVIKAGKLRRYHGESWLQRLLDVKTIFYNIRDIAYIAIGFFQSFVILLVDRPDVVFAKGGFVCLPMGLAAALLGVKLVIHDSDTRPGLTNKILGRFAAAVGTGSPLENYSYDISKSRFVGVPINSSFRPYSEADKRKAKAALGMDTGLPLVVVTGGGLGAKSINDAMVRGGDALIGRDIQVYHITGKKHYNDVHKAAPQSPLYKTVAFVYENMPAVLGAADIIVARGSATFIQEMAGMRKPIIVVPASHLGDQVKNAAVYQKAEAAKVLTDGEITKNDTMSETIIAMLDDMSSLDAMAKRLHTFAKPRAAQDMADMIIGVAREGRLP